MAIESNYSSLSNFDNRIRLLGLNNSFFDTTALAEAEIQALEMQIRPKINQKEIFTAEMKAWENFKKDFGTLTDMLQKLRLYDSNKKDVSYTKENVVSLSADAKAIAGDYRFTVQHLAQRHQIAGKDMGANSEAMGLSDTVTLNGKELAITSEMSLRDVVNRINEGSYGASASIVSNRIVLSSSVSGQDSAISLADGDNKALEQLGLVTESGDFANELQKGQDAQFTINGITLTNSSNVVTGAIEGVTINLRSTSTEEVGAEITQDNDKIVEEIQKFVTGYNKAVLQLNAYTDKGTYLQGQLIPINVRRELSSVSSFIGNSGGYLFEAGIQIDGDMKDGSLRFDENKLRELLNEDPQKVKEMFFGENGVAKFLKDKLDPFTKETGSLNTKIKGLQSSIDTLTETIDRFDITYEQQRNSILNRYAQFETMMAQLNAQASYMEAQLKAFTGNKD